MDLHPDGNAKAVDSTDSALAAELTRILETARQQLEEEFRKRLEAAVRDAESASEKAVERERERLEAAVRDAESASEKAIEREREQSVAQARLQVTAELRGQFDQTLQQNNARLQAEFEERMGASTKQWEEEKARLQEQLAVWRTYADAQRQMAESHTQAEILGHFLDRAESFAPNLAVYVAKPDGLALWKTRGRMAFPNVVSKDTIDPDAYFKTIVVRERVVAAVCARHPLKPESLDFLSGVLSRAIETFGMRLQNQPPVAVS
jgi:hypothetical protein